MTDPLEKPKELIEEAERGRSASTPLIALSGVTLVVGIGVGALIAVILVAYYLAR